MARVFISDLIDAVGRDPRYPRWEKQVPATAALHVAFHATLVSGLKTQVYEAADGRDVFLELGADGKVYGIEIT